jgi:hypothetical protein
MKQRTRRLIQPARAAFVVAAVVVSAFGFSRPPSTAARLPRGFEITVREVRTESSFREPVDSIVTENFRSSLSYFGRVERPLDGEKKTLTVHTDSLSFESDAPFRFTAHIHRDTIEVTSDAKRPATRMGALEVDDAMLRCLFEGPALRIRVPAQEGSAVIEDLKAQCAGGLYRRLKLPVTFGVFVLGVPPRENDSGGRWQTTDIRPSFAGLGHFPQLRWSYKVVDIQDASNTSAESIEIECDTTLTHVRTVMPNGETVDIIADHIRVRGLLRPWRDAPFLHEGEIKIEEDIRYVRPKLGPSVMHAECHVEIVLEQR